jgi:hypothetical protein
VAWKVGCKVARAVQRGWMRKKVLDQGIRLNMSHLSFQYSWTSAWDAGTRVRLQTPALQREFHCSSPLEPLKYDVHCQETGASRPVLSKVQWRVATQGPPLLNGLFRFQKTSYELSLGRTSQSSLTSYQMKLYISCNPYCLSATRLASLNWEAWSVHSHVFQVLSENFFGCILQTLIFHSYSAHQRSLARSRFFQQHGWDHNDRYRGRTP